MSPKRFPTIRQGAVSMEERIQTLEPEVRALKGKPAPPAAITVTEGPL